MQHMQHVGYMQKNKFIDKNEDMPEVNILEEICHQNE